MIRIWNKMNAVNRRVIGMNRRNVELIYPHNSYKFYTLADDKIKTKTILEKTGIACAPTYAIIESIGHIEQAWKTVQYYSKLAIKPANGSGGGGIKILRKNPGNDQWISGGRPIETQEIFKHFADIIMGIYSLSGQDRVLIEYCIEPHPFFHEIYPNGVPDFRIILLKRKPIMAMLRVPTDQSGGKANLHQGGLGIGVDMEKGQLTNGYDGYRYHQFHPDTDKLLKGRPIPLWEQTVELAISTAKAFPLDYLGVDIVLDKELGPLIMEINVRPGLGIQMANQRGLQEVLREADQYL